MDYGFLFLLICVAWLYLVCAFDLCLLIMFCLLSFSSLFCCYKCCYYFGYDLLIVYFGACYSVYLCGLGLFGLLGVLCVAELGFGLLDLIACFCFVSLGGCLICAFWMWVWVLIWFAWVVGLLWLVVFWLRDCFILVVLYLFVDCLRLCCVACLEFLVGVRFDLAICIWVAFTLAVVMHNVG